MPNLTLDLRYLHYAIAAADHGSFRRAAMALGVAQSSISRRVQALEDRLGAPIFERCHSGIRPTAVGQQFLKDASVGVDQLNRAIEAMGRVRSAELGQLQIGILASLSSGFLRTLLHRYATRHPGVKVRLQVGTPEEHTARLIAGQIDVAFLTGEPKVAGCETMPLWTEHVLIAFPEDHPLAARDEVGWDEVRRETFIVTCRGPGPEISDYLIKRLSDLSFRPHIEPHDVGRDDLMHMVAIGFGLTLTSASILGTAFPGLVFRPMAGSRTALPSSAVWQSNNKNPALKRLLAAARLLSDRFDLNQIIENRDQRSLYAALKTLLLPVLLLAEPAQRLGLLL